MEISIILQELYDTVSPFFRCNYCINNQTFFLYAYSGSFTIILVLLDYNYYTLKNFTVKKGVRHYHRISSLLLHPIVFSNIVSTGPLGADITHFSSALVETVKIPGVKNPFIPDAVYSVRKRKNGIITLLQNSPILFFSAGGSKN
jgi:hypothetical protein